MSRDLNMLCWPVSRWGDAIEALARYSGLAPRVVQTPVPPRELTQAGSENIGRWIESAAEWLGVEAEPIGLRYADVSALLRSCGPVLCRLSHDNETLILVILDAGRRGVRVLAPDLSICKVEAGAIREALCHEIEAPVLVEADRLLKEASVSPRRRGRARSAILRQRLGMTRIGECWSLRMPASTSFWRQMHRAGVLRRLMIALITYTAQYLLWILSWLLIGQGALQGRLDRGWLLAWALVLFTLVPFRLLGTWSQGLMSVVGGGLLKRRLLDGILRLEPEEIRHQGAGQLLGRVMESEALESLALSGGFLGLVSIIELMVAGVVLAFGAGGWLHVALLIAWVAVALVLGWRYAQHRSRWTAARLTMTHELVEQMAGHRTRLAQEPPQRWHDGEDQAVERYLALSRAMDTSGARLSAVMPRGWLVLGLAGLAPFFVYGQNSPSALAIALGGILMAYQALQQVTASLSHLAGAGIAWSQVASFFRAAARPEVPGSPALALHVSSADGASSAGQAIMDIHDVAFRHRGRGEPVLRGCSLSIRGRDRLLLEGPSGGGKSTLTALMSGLRRPESGLILLRGLDYRTLGAEGWRRRVAAAPQYHENHILTGTLAFNLLMGRRWPPRLEDVGHAESLCRELGLGDLIDRMPGGLLQVVGETGWQLSQGERSRVYIARALLQDAYLVILDESFAALDPENFERSMRCVLERTGALLVVAHP